MGVKLIYAVSALCFTALLCFPVKIGWLAISDIASNLVYFFIGAVSVELYLHGISLQLDFPDRSLLYHF